MRAGGAVYDLLPAELELVKLGSANKYTDQTMVKGVLSGLPFLSLVTLAMDNLFTLGRSGADAA
ncbi:hypothetical protein [Cupriavidus taiwanensis]|uniref:Uncharacterized protein n=2 Tax=Cupriavidus taiwanensis TaxID=164546 RepID=B3RCM4_CUPTR|nr:hypothetical protein [Cupriavidus taiwanensis]CAQ72649.1 hypothetical protein RALTA_B2071 [Cupriavidus taiwanensis LMG 19424]SOZ08813.1 hypothetical protein CBM2597_B10617 [Cupriavidus taiwanensis]SOZ11149.1 hypothetical protein CBM2595_B10344 [Cupriavidus taiwanensis]SOZ42499.1 hypothetical protein CBM2598_B10864 [Cupriavidus taiwanensis]SPC21512.1 hypothetical protein CBM2594_B10616 [Cupriavidus taiwanensis]